MQVAIDETRLEEARSRLQQAHGEEQNEIAEWAREAAEAWVLNIAMPSQLRKVIREVEAEKAPHGYEFVVRGVFVRDDWDWFGEFNKEAPDLGNDESYFREFVRHAIRVAKVVM